MELEAGAPVLLASISEESDDAFAFFSSRRP
jgi:hypothetical protein